MSAPTSQPNVGSNVIPNRSTKCITIAQSCTHGRINLESNEQSDIESNFWSHKWTHSDFVEQSNTWTINAAGWFNGHLQRRELAVANIRRGWQGTGDPIFWFNFDYRGRTLSSVDTIGAFPLRIGKGTGLDHIHRFVIDLSSKYKYPGQ